MSPHQTKRTILIVKVGTSTLTQVNPISGIPQLYATAFHRIGKQVATLHDHYDILVVTSAAITAGMSLCELQQRPRVDKSMPELQRLASLGTASLLHEWQTALPGKRLGCLLLTQLSLHRRSTERSRAINVILEHLAHRDIPIVNENDAIATEEISYGDNDTLAAEIAIQLHAEGRSVELVLLSDVDGVYQNPADPTTLVRQINDVAQWSGVAEGTATHHGTGGMRTKFIAAQMAMQAGINMYIANGNSPTAVADALARRAGTHFVAST